MNSSFTHFQAKLVDALLIDLSSILKDDVTALAPFIKGLGVERLCLLSKSFYRLVIDGSTPVQHDMVSTRLMPFISTRMRNVRVLTRTCDPFAVQGILQLLSVFKKWESGQTGQCGELTKFERRITSSGLPMKGACNSHIKQRVANLLGGVPDLAGLEPHHGPGAVFDGAKNEEKWNFEVLPDALLRHGGVDLFHLNERHWLFEPNVLRIQRHMISRSCVVPKDYRGGRVIAIEPKELQFLQQAVKRHLYTRLSRASHNEINFTDQALHRELLRDPNMASLDLKDASDMVSRRVVSSLVPREWKDLLFALRSNFCKTESGLHRIKAFALMGSALCFPIEALIHYAIVREVVPAYEAISVYGDDIIVPRKYAYDVILKLREFGLIPNTLKCCYRTPFRESCGLELFGTAEVTPIYIRRECDGIHSGLSLVSSQNELYLRGYYTTAQTLATRICRYVSLPCSPCATLTPKGFTWCSVDSVLKLSASISYRPTAHTILSELPLKGPRTRWRKCYQRLEYLIPMLVKKTRPSSLNGYSGLFESLVSTYADRLNTSDESIVWRWVSL